MTSFTHMLSNGFYQYHQEATVFPILNEKMDFSHERDQHKELHDFLEKFLVVIKDARENTSKFNGEEIKELMLSAKDIMVRRSDFSTI